MAITMTDVQRAPLSPSTPLPHPMNSRQMGPGSQSHLLAQAASKPEEAAESPSGSRGAEGVASRDGTHTTAPSKHLTETRGGQWEHQGR